MASGLCGVVVLALCAILCPCVSAGDSDCMSYTDSTNMYQGYQSCYGEFCCGTCYNRYCCRQSYMQLSEDKQEQCEAESILNHSTPVHMIFGIVGTIIILLIFICCCVCPCCCMYKVCRKPQPVVATSTHTTIVTAAPLNYPQQPTATPSQPQPYQGGQYQPYQPVPVQPGYGTQPMPQGYGAQPMPAVPFQGQPFVPGPPPTYQEATGPVYSPNPMSYSQAAFSPNQPAYPLKPPVQPQVQPPPNAPLANTDYLAQPAYNPAYAAP
ncbi:putative protein shisa-4-like [Scophthalmus maximus]|uniref:Protein shisa-5 n=1 Tax=Scophthalmus maximus TaxID=52904 RepID=A0A2U9BF88_SCOMX|nr:protein shisa-4 [Scophthalmus maximus]AWP02587.1 putative protein shisa-4-like [Scophthalmus maximus]KAF0034485.1 hypothetical protein F2P81_012243 [Scophthalmus maximus]